MEERINGIFAILSSKQVEMGETPQSLLTTPFPEPTHSHSPQSSLSILSHHPDLIAKTIITYSEASDSLSLFRAQAARFPFVIVKPDVTVDDMRRSRPFLLLAILAFGTQKQKQAQVEVELRLVLARRVVVDMEKSLDLLQGLLVYIAWSDFLPPTFHFCLRVIDSS